MRVTNQINNPMLMMPQNSIKNQTKPIQLNRNHITENPVKVSISQEGYEHIRSSIQQNGQEIYKSVMQRREMLKKTRVMSYGYDLSMKAVELNDAASENGTKPLSVADRANSYIGAYASLYDEIVQGYENGTREIYVEDELGIHRLTKEEELKELNESYKRAVDDFVTMEKANEQAYAIVTEAMKKIDSIKSKSRAGASDYDNPTEKERHKVPENLKERMLGAAELFKQNYAKLNPDTDNLSQVLSRINLT